MDERVKFDTGLPLNELSKPKASSSHPYFAIKIFSLGWTMLKYVIFLLPLVAGQQLSSQPRRITANVRRIVGPAASDPVVGRLQEVGNSVNFGAPNINSNIDVTNVSYKEFHILCPVYFFFH